MGSNALIVLDTHALIWWVSGSHQLSNKALKVINKTLKAKEEVLISSISVWEIAMLVRKNRLALSMDVNQWIATSATIEGVRYVPLDNEISINSVQLPGDFHANPADRIIVALARKLNALLVSADQKILNYAHVNSIW